MFTFHFPLHTFVSSSLSSHPLIPFSPLFLLVFFIHFMGFPHFFLLYFLLYFLVFVFYPTFWCLYSNKKVPTIHWWLHYLKSQWLTLDNHDANREKNNLNWSKLIMYATTQIFLKFYSSSLHIQQSIQAFNFIIKEIFLKWCTYL